VDPEDPREPAQRRELGRLLLRRRAAGGGHPERGPLGAPTLRRAPGAAQDALGLRLRLHEREDALRDGLPAERLEPERRPPRLAVLRPPPERHLPPRRGALRPEEVLERDSGPLLRVHLAGAEPLLQLLR